MLFRFAHRAPVLGVLVSSRATLCVSFAVFLVDPTAHTRSDSLRQAQRSGTELFLDPLLPGLRQS